MKKYLLDTNICIYFLKGQFELHNKIEEVGEENCYLSEITIAELKYGAETANKKKEIERIMKNFFPNLRFFQYFLHLIFTLKIKLD